MFRPLDIPYPEFNGTRKVEYLCLKPSVELVELLKARGYTSTSVNLPSSSYLSISVRKGYHDAHLFRTTIGPRVGKLEDYHYVVPDDVLNRLLNNKRAIQMAYLKELP